MKTRLQVYGQPVTPTAGHDYGLQLRQLSRMLEAHGLTVTARRVDDGLSRGFIKAELVMDTVPAAADWAWIKAEVLIAAMNTRDVSENRGYLLISD